MSKYIPGNQKHLTLEDRKYIEKSLNAGCSFKDIARYLCKDPTTISKEIRLHRLSDWYHKGCFNNAHNFCVHRYHCKKVNACGKIILCGVKCTTCPTCNQTCPDFVKERCNRLDKAPYVCNGCPKAINHCTIAHKYRYDAIFADRKYKECLSQSRTGINMTRHELHQKDMVITPLIFQGQSPYQIITNHPELDMSVRTLYSYLDKGILTFFLTREKLFLAFIMNRCTKGTVKLVFNKLERQLGIYDFLTLFNTILTDRGSEFGDPESLENGINGIMRSSIYYCDPMRSGQKGGIEQAHTMLRMILPKKTSFEYLTQWDLRTIVDHINSTPRESLGGRTPYDVALAVLGFIQCLSNLLNQCHIRRQLLYICVYKYLHSYIQLKSPPVTASDNSLSIFSTSSTPLTI